MDYFFRGIGGGLGDFLCNYASMKALSLDHQRDFYLYGWKNFLKNCHFPGLGIKIDTQGWEDLFQENYRFVEEIRLEHKIYTTVELPYQPLDSITFDSGPIHIAGFPFSNQYFEHRLSEIKSTLNIPDKNNFSLLFEKDDVVLNTRRGEWPGASPDFIDLCFTDYYYQALSELKPKRIFLVSDDLNWTQGWYNATLKDYFPHAQVQVFQDKPITQFEFMIKAPNLIICQSQFSRWAGILNENAVYSPYKWYHTLDRHTRACNLENWRTIKYAIK